MELHYKIEVMIYIALLMRGHVVTSEDMILMPFGEKLINLHEKRRKKVQ